MIDPASQPCPITIITGFLGAGKTTLLNRLLRSQHGLKLAVLVNDFGAINIDAQLIVGIEGETIRLQNGCICCSIRDDLREAVLGILARSPRPDHVLIETSGVSDPYAVAQTFLQDPTLKQHTFVDCICTLVDAEQALDLSGEQFGLAMDQISTADLVLLNKTDLVSQAQLADMHDWVLSLAPNARILPTTYGGVPLSLLFGSGQFDPMRLSARTIRDIHIHDADSHPHHHAGHELVFGTWHYQSSEQLSLNAIKQAVSRLPAAVYRAKGVLWVAEDPSRRAIVQVVGKRGHVSWGEIWGDNTPISQLVVIGVQGEIDAAVLQRSFDHCRISVAGNASADPFEQAMRSYRGALRQLQD